uniref:TRASH domain-containing protein n=1 Tax=Periophthalmus magnuspinnatus TaxID=409849 RepID=A0A3B4B9Q2_9GOBI
MSRFLTSTYISMKKRRKNCNNLVCAQTCGCPSPPLYSRVTSNLEWILQPSPRASPPPVLQGPPARSRSSHHTAHTELREMSSQNTSNQEAILCLTGLTKMFNKVKSSAVMMGHMLRESLNLCVPFQVTCANCKKPLKKGQTAYQRKGSTHLFCSTTCLSAFSHKPAPKKSCTMCKKDITNMKGTIVAQVDSSESFQEFCSTGCLGAYENKQNPPKSGVKTKCTVCGKLTEIRHEVSFKTVTHRICSDTCFNVYRRANGLIMNCCEQCGDYLPSRTSANHFLLVDGQQKRFCCHNCIRDFKQVWPREL